MPAACQNSQRCLSAAVVPPAREVVPHLNCAMARRSDPVRSAPPWTQERLSTGANILRGIGPRMFAKAQVGATRRKHRTPNSHSDGVRKGRWR